MSNDTKKLYVPQFVDKNSYAFDEFYVRFMHNEECPGQYFQLPVKPGISYQASTGFLTKENQLTIEIYKHGFCVDNFHQSGQAIQVSGFVCQMNSMLSSNYELKNRTFEGTCHDKYLVKFNKALRAVYSFCGIFSLAFLLITIFVYMTLPSLKNLHGKIVLSNVFSILLTTIFLVVIYNVQKDQEGHKGQISEGEFLILIPAPACRALGYILYYTGISMFCWMSVMCIDLCWTFGRAKIPRKGSDRMKFLSYSLFGWGKLKLIRQLM